MMILRSSAASPFGRKIKIAAAILGLRDRLSIEMTDTLDPADTIRDQNPLGKIPALILEDGSVLYDSRVIADYWIILPAARRSSLPRPHDSRFSAFRRWPTASPTPPSCAFTKHGFARPTNTNRNGSSTRPARSTVR